MPNKYPKYKDSGIEWIGEIPSHWKSSPICYISSVDNSGIWGEDELAKGRLGVLVPTTAQITIDGKWLIDEMSIRYITHKEKDYYICRTGDIIVVKSSGSASNIISGKSGFISEVENEQFSFGNFLLRLRPSDYNPKLLYYFLSCHLTKQRIERMVSSTTYPNLKVDEYIKSQVLLPPSAEQQAIADYLDDKTALIDELIGKKRRQIELLKEQRAAIINQAVTKGLDSKVKMKDSQIEWLGEIPKHWDKDKISRVVDPKRKITYGIVQPGELCPNGIFMVRGQDYSDGWTEPEKIFKVSPEIEAPYKRSRLLSGDILITIVGAGLGNTAIVPDWLNQANITQTTARIAINPDKGSNKFYKYVLESNIGKYNVKIYAKGAAQPGLNLEHVAIFRVPLLPFDEQDSIVKYLDNKINEIDNIISKTQKQIQLLQEYRTALISEAVTGKIDVREN